VSAGYEAWKFLRKEVKPMTAYNKPEIPELGDAAVLLRGPKPSYGENGEPMQPNAALDVQIDGLPRAEARLLKRNEALMGRTLQTSSDVNLSSRYGLLVLEKV
jgi:hypothetical protein